MLVISGLKAQQEAVVARPWYIEWTVAFLWLLVRNIPMEKKELSQATYGIYIPGIGKKSLRPLRLFPWDHENSFDKFN